MKTREDLCPFIAKILVGSCLLPWTLYGISGIHGLLKCHSILSAYLIKKNRCETQKAYESDVAWALGKIIITFIITHL
jgi:hypothetical protein